MARSEDPKRIQREYYSRTAHEYDTHHVAGEPEHDIALRYISALLEPLRIKSVLDVGCGTGRGIVHVRNSHPALTVLGVDPVDELLRMGVAKGIPSAVLIKGDACTLPFKDASFDAAMALGVLHHVPNPECVVGEMLRVARRAIFVSDSNIFGQGPALARAAKFLLHRAGLWKAFKSIQTGGRGYFTSEGDGLAYSYSAYFQYGQLAEWGDRVISVPLSSSNGARRWGMPLFDEAHILLCALRDSGCDMEPRRPDLS